MISNEHLHNKLKQMDQKLEELLDLIKRIPTYQDENPLRTHPDEAEEEKQYRETGI